MTQHPITPPPELVQQWLLEYYGGDLRFLDLEHDEWYLLRCAAQWGYQQHERALLDAMHSIVPQPYDPEGE